MKKKSESDFENFVGNKKTKFCIVKFTVCENTLYVRIHDVHFVCCPQNFQKLDSKNFSCQNRKSELSIGGLIISGLLQKLRYKKAA